jgi:hypothetical protein
VTAIAQAPNAIQFVARLDEFLEMRISGSASYFEGDSYAERWCITLWSNFARTLRAFIVP